MKPRRTVLSVYLYLLYLLPVPAWLQAQRVTEIQIAPPFMRMVPDAQAALVATAYDPNGNPASVALRWASSNINIATVDSVTGLVHAISPGNAVIIASLPPVEGRRVVARAVVYVMRPPGQRPATRRFTVVTPGDVTPPAAGAPGAAPATPAPGMPAMPAMPPGMDPRTMDSLMRANVNCNEPFLNSVNPGHACWDHRAELKDSAFVAPPRPAGADCERLTMVMIFVEVDEKGTVQRVQSFGSGRCPQYSETVVEAARHLSFAPAQKGDQPIRSWYRLVVHPQ